MADTWVVDNTGIRQSTKLSTHGTGFTDVWEVPYRITSGPAQGVSGVVSVPADLYNAENVARVIQAAVDAHTEVAAL